MVFKNLYLILFIFILFIIIEISYSCHLIQDIAYESYENCMRRLNPITVYDFGGDFSGCVMAYSRGQLYKFGGMYYCYAEAKWDTKPSFNGQICKRRDGWLCETRIKEGRYDATWGACVVCDETRKIKDHYFSCEMDYPKIDPPICESACGADEECDESFPESLSLNRNDVFCTYTCDALKCDRTHECKSIFSPSRSVAYTCVYFPFYEEYMWLENPKELYYEGCFDNYDNDCDNLKDCNDPDCRGIKSSVNPNIVCCQTNEDCVGKLNCNNGILICNTTTKRCECITSDECDPSVPNSCSFYEVKCKPYTAFCNPQTKKCECRRTCRITEECAQGFCCKYEITRKEEDMICVEGGYIFNYEGKSYLCDPPEYLNVPTSNKIYKDRENYQNIFEFILNYFKNINLLYLL